MRTKNCRRCAGSGKELDNKSVGREMHQLRNSRGLTQTVVAGNMNFSSAYISQLEKGLRDWSHDLVKAYQKACEQ